MPTYKTLGIVIRRRNINEADRMLTILTEEQGKVTVVAKGVRKTLSRLGGHLELFNLVNFVLAKGRSMDIVTGAVVERQRGEIAIDLDKVARASRFAELIDILVHDKEEHRKLFWLFEDCLNYLDRSKGANLVDLYFFINTLSYLGYLPELYECVKCRERLKEGNIGWSHGQGGVLCGDCLDEGIRTDVESIKLLRLLAEEEPSVVEQLNLSRELVQNVQEVLSGFVNFLSQRELKCDKFWKSLQVDLRNFADLG
ncbi:MAG: DNA repair protein RecO [bacterium]|nr:DNA repair protein RecO [bacterium]